MKQHDYLPTKDAKILSATVSEKAGRWFVSVLVEMDQPEYEGIKDDHAIIGIDLGIKTLAVCSDGQEFQNPKALGRNLRRLRRLSKHHSRKQKGSKNRKKAAAKLANLYNRITNIRRDGLHKMTTTLAKTKRVVGIEDLNISGMLQNRCLSRAISDLGLFEWRRQLGYKGIWYGCQIVVADRFFPSSKRCAECGSINHALSLADRQWVCDGCGVVHDRDFNASMNLEYVAIGLMETQNACGEESSGLTAMLSETASMKQERDR